MELSSSNTKKFLTFSQKKTFFIFRAMETPKKFLVFQETKLSYISGNGNSKKLLIFHINFPSSKNKKNPKKRPGTNFLRWKNKHPLRKNILYFRKWNFLVPKNLKFFETF